MSYDLIEYFNKRFPVSDIKKETFIKKKPGPFVTISRETGCEGSGVAEILISKLKEHNSRWKLINKEIIIEAAQKLKVDPGRVYEVIESSERSTIDEILDALSYKYYKNDRVVRKNLAEIIRFDAKQGHVVIVGRGGVVVTGDIPNGIHIKLTAPLSWRVKEIMHKNKLSKAEAEKYVIETDTKRKKLIEQLSNNKIDNVYFDITINRETFNKEQTASIILNAMEIKRLF